LYSKALSSAAFIPFLLLEVARTEWSPHRQEPVAPFKNATSRE